MELRSTFWKAAGAKAEMPRLRLRSRRTSPARIAVTDPRSGVTTYGYDLAGNLTSLTDSVGNQTTYGYDAANRQTQMTDPRHHAATYAYDAANQLTSMTDRDSRTINYGYDQAGRLTGETWVSGSYTATFSYNKDSLVTLAQDTFSQYSYSYNADKQVTSVSNAGTPGVPTVTLSYNHDGYMNVTSLTDSLGGSVAYGYDLNNQLNSVSLSLGSTVEAQVTMGYDAANRLTGMTLTGVSGTDKMTSALSYDNANRLRNITDTDTTKATTLANYTYGYDQGNQLTSYTDNSSSSLTYGYDADRQLTSASGTLNGSSYSVSYSYDTNGNRTMTGYSTGTGNELTSDGTYSYTYDNNGNLTTQTTIATGAVTYYTWDYRNRLTEVKEQTSGGTVIYDETFTYDVNNNRIGVALGGVQQSYTVYDGKNPYIDFNGSGTLTQRYLVNPQTLSQFYGQVSGSGTTQWFLTDNINSVRQVVSTSGTVLDKITYDPYGNIVNQTNSANAPRFLYTGGAYDSNTGDYQDDARYYNPSAGRFVSQDPLAFKAGDTDLYRYVFNDPTSRSDPSGEDFNLGRGLKAGTAGAIGGGITGSLIPGVGTGFGAGLGFVGGFIYGAFFAPNDTYAIYGGFAYGAAAPLLWTTLYALGVRAVTALGAGGGAAAQQQAGNPFPANAQPGQILQNINPNTLIAGNRAALVAGRLQQQQQLITQGIQRTSPIQVTPDGIIYDGHHGAAAASQAGLSVTVQVVDQSITSTTGLPVTGLPIH